MKIHLNLIHICMILFAMSATAAWGEGEVVNGSIAKMPVYAEDTEKGVLVDLVKAIARTGNRTIDYKVLPFQRSMTSVINREVDFHMPLIKHPAADEKTLNYDLSTATLFHVNFVLYTHKNKPIDRTKIAAYKVETDAAHVHYFHPEIIGSPNIESSLKKLNAGRIDGFIFADNASDLIIKNQNLANIHRELYQVFEVKAVLPKGDNGKAVDLFLSETIQKLKENGQYGTIMDAIDKPYNDWQP